MKEIGQNLNKKTLYLTVLIKIGVTCSNLINQNVNLSLDSVLNNVNSILDVHAQASAYAKQGCATIRHPVMKFRGYRRVKSHTPPTK